MSIAIIVLSALLAVTFLGSGGLKLVGAKQSLQMRDQYASGRNCGAWSERWRSPALWDWPPDLSSRCLVSLPRSDWPC
jgi:hypothetical protein